MEKTHSKKIRAAHFYFLEIIPNHSYVPGQPTEIECEMEENA